jgi:hypothetical protein
MHYTLIVKFGISAVLALGLAAPGVALGAEKPLAPSSVSSHAAGNITLSAR